MSGNQKFFAWLDGELGGEEAAQMEAEVARDPELTRLAEQHHAVAVRLRATFDAVAQAPLPQRLAEAVRPPAPEVVDFGEARQARDRRLAWFAGPQWAAMAATLVAGILVGTMIPGRGTAPVEMRDGRLYAAAALDEALRTQLAGAPARGDVRIGMTFRDQSGAICRSFTETQASGLACRSGDGWQVRGVFATPEGQSGAYRMAAGMDPNLAALIDSTIAGDPLDGAQEQAARAKDWR